MESQKWLEVPHESQRLIYDHVTMNQFTHAGNMYMPGSRLPMEGGSVGIVNLYVTNLPIDADVSLLLEIFAPYGRITGAEIKIDSGNNGGLHSVDTEQRIVCGIVQIEGLHAAYLAAQALSGLILYEGARPISVSIGT